jgi:hypothetical protein
MPCGSLYPTGNLGGNTVPCTRQAFRIHPIVACWTFVIAQSYFRLYKGYVGFVIEFLKSGPGTTYSMDTTSYSTIQYCSIF